MLTCEPSNIMWTSKHLNVCGHLMYCIIVSILELLWKQYLLHVMFIFVWQKIELHMVACPSFGKFLGPLLVGNNDIRFKEEEGQFSQSSTNNWICPMKQSNLFHNMDQDMWSLEGRATMCGSARERQRPNGFEVARGGTRAWGAGSRWGLLRLALSGVLP